MYITAAQLHSVFIEVPQQAESEVMTFAATELQRYLQRIINVAVSIKDTVEPGSSPVFHLNYHPIAGLPDDSFQITITETDVNLEATSPRGVLYAVYSLLQDLGCKWIHPGEAEEVVPQYGELRLTHGTRTERPHIEHRGLALYGLYKDTVELGYQMIDWMGKNRLNLLLTSWDRPDEPTNTQTMTWPEVADRLLPELKRRGILLEMSEHATHYFFPRTLFSEHPEWFALVNGERRPKQMCYSNADGVKYFGQRLAEFAVAHPEVDILGAWPLDGGGYCECAGCQQLDTVFKATMRMGEMVHSVRPDITLEHLAYKPQTFSIPKVEIPEYMSALVCNRTDQLARDWAQAMHNKRGAYYFEYKTADQYHWAANVWLRPRYAVDITRTAIDIGYRGVIPLFLPMYTWWHTSINIYFYARACWHPQMDVDAELDRYCEAYYGEAAQQVRTLLNTVIDKVQDPGLLENHAYGSVDNLRSSIEAEARSRSASEQVLAQLGSLEETVADDTVRLRVQRLKVYVEHFLFCQAFRAAQDTSVREKAFQRFCAYADAHAGEHFGVCTTADFILWRMPKR